MVNGRLLLCGYDVSLHLWRDAKYDCILEANGVPFRIEIKSTGLKVDPLTNPKSFFGFTSGARSGGQISRAAKSRERNISTEDVDFAIGVSSHDGTLWIVPVELLQFIGHKPIIKYLDVFKEKVGVFQGLNTDLDSRKIRDGFSHLNVATLENICSKLTIPITNTLQQGNFSYPWQKSPKTSSIDVSYKDSLVLDIWKYIFQNL